MLYALRFQLFTSYYYKFSIKISLSKQLQHRFFNVVKELSHFKADLQILGKENLKLFSGKKKNLSWASGSWVMHKPDALSSISRPHVKMEERTDPSELCSASTHVPCMCVHIHSEKKKKMKILFKRQQNWMHPLYQTVTQANQTLAITSTFSFTGTGRH